MSPNVNTHWDTNQVVEVASCQKFMIWLILLQLVSLFLVFFAAVTGPSTPISGTATDGLVLLFMIARIVIGVLSIYGVYKMARSLQKGTAIIYAVACLIPIIGLILLISLSTEATRVLQENGVSVGLMGANSADLERLKNQSGLTP